MLSISVTFGVTLHKIVQWQNYGVMMDFTDEVNNLTFCTAPTTDVTVVCIGNDNIHLLTSVGHQKLRVDMEDWEGNKVFAEYDNFAVGTELEKYKLTSLGSFTGSVGVGQCTM